MKLLKTAQNNVFLMITSYRSQPDAKTEQALSRSTTVIFKKELCQRKLLQSKLLQFET